MTDSGGGLELQADLAAARGDFAQAERLLLQATDLQGDVRLYVKLSAVRRRSGDLDGAMAALTSALTIEPLDFVSLLMRASVLSAQQKADEAAAAYEAAIFHAPPDDRLGSSIRAELSKARDVVRAHQARREARLLSSAEGAIKRSTAAEQRRIERFASNMARRTRAYPQAPSHFHFPGMPIREFYARDDFPFLDDLEVHTDTIAAEFDALLRQEAAELVPYVQYPADVPLAQWRSLNHSRSWTAMHLWRMGERVERKEIYLFF